MQFGIWPAHVVRLRDVMFCHAHGIPPMSSIGAHDVLLKHKAFSFSDNRNNDIFIQEKNYEFPCWKALESERGVLLFSDSENGKLAERKYRQYIVDHFFDPKFHIEFLNEYRVPTYMSLFVDQVNSFYDLRIKRATEREQITPIPQSFFASSELVKTGFCHARFDLSPTGQNFRQFAEGLKVPMDTCRLATLLYMLETGRCDAIHPEHNQEYPYIHQCYDLYMETWDLETNNDEYKAGVRELGETILHKEFPGDFRGKERLFLKEESSHKSLSI